LIRRFEETGSATMTSPEPAPDSARRQPRGIVLGRKHAVLAAIAAALVDGLLVARADTGLGTKIFSVFFMAGFVYVGFRLVTTIRYRLRPPLQRPENQNPTNRPAAGGWANPTSAQTNLAKLMKPFKRSR
jgi:hypothetical protein